MSAPSLRPSGTFSLQWFLSQLGPFSGNEDSKPTTADNLALRARVEAAPKTAPVLVPDAVSYRERARRKAANATPAEKAAVVLSELPEHPLRKLAAELAQGLWNEDKSNPRQSVSALEAQYVPHWLSDEPWNRHDIRGSRVTVDAAVANAMKLVADLDAADPDWFVRRTEKNI